MNATQFRFYNRESKQFANYDFKIEVHDGTRWLEGKDLSTAYYSGSPQCIADKLRPAVDVLCRHGLEDGQIPLLLSRKQVHTNTPLPIKELADIGWNSASYPEKFGKVKDTRRLIIESYDSGIGVDVSNIVSHPITRDTNGLALKGLVDKLDGLCFKSFLYVDKTTWPWLERQGLYSLIHYLKSSCNGSLFAKVVTAPFDKTADDLMVDWADRRRQPQITRDELDEYDTRYDWLLHGAERGEPRIHKFFRVDYKYIRVPSFDFNIEIPERF